MLEPVSNVSNVFYVDLENSDLEEVAKKLGLGLLKDEMENVRELYIKGYIDKKTYQLETRTLFDMATRYGA